MSASAVYCIGGINVDFQVRSERWPEDAETLETTDFLRAPGGKGANRAFIARKLGAPAVLAGCVGDDDFGEEALLPLRQIGVDVTQVRRARGQSTGVAMIVVRPDGAKTILLAANANAHTESGDAARIEQVIGDAPSGSVVSVDLEIPPAIVAAALKAARARGLKVIVDPSPAYRMKDEYYEQVDWLTPNHTEAKKLTGIEITDRERAKAAAHKLVQAGARGVCVKLSNGGCAAVTRTDAGLDEFVIDAPKVEVVDKTGAGDAFAGALSTATLERQPARDAVRFAVCASTLATTKNGSQASYPNRETLQRLLSESSE